MALRLSLRPFERVIISGAVIQNGPSRTDLSVENQVPVLRETDILSPAAVRTPCERIYLALQLAYVDPDQGPRHLAAYEALAAEVRTAAPSCGPLLERIEGMVALQRYYQALKAAADLLDYERELMAYVQ